MTSSIKSVQNIVNFNINTILYKMIFQGLLFSQSNMLLVTLFNYVVLFTEQNE